MSRWNVADVMTFGAVSVTEDTPFKEIVDLLEAHGVNAVPVVDGADRVIGVVSSADLLPKIERAGAKMHATAAGELMTAPAITVSGTAALPGAARVMDAAGLKRLPVVDATGRLLGMVTRRDLLKVFLRSDEEIRREVAGLCARTGVRVEVADGVVTLLGEVGREAAIPSFVRRVERVDGVVDVVSLLG
ncbi:CBS domain-containing protein [Dactylosporangium sp. NPDC000244]|uniref:CBS domain-containing protein n=1 Tax=Dactylosporangium sp. NPDC000244 TaxID=3154365 RepID=UPI003327DE93